LAEAGPGLTHADFGASAPPPAAPPIPGPPTPSEPDRAAVAGPSMISPTAATMAATIHIPAPETILARILDTFSAEEAVAKALAQAIPAALLQPSGPGEERWQAPPPGEVAPTVQIEPSGIVRPTEPLPRASAEPATPTFEPALDAVSPDTVPSLADDADDPYAVPSLAEVVDAWGRRVGQATEEILRSGGPAGPLTASEPHSLDEPTVEWTVVGTSPTTTPVQPVAAVVHEPAPTAPPDPGRWPWATPAVIGRPSPSSPPTPTDAVPTSTAIVGDEPWAYSARTPAEITSPAVDHAATAASPAPLDAAPPAPLDATPPAPLDAAPDATPPAPLDTDHDATPADTTAPPGEPAPSPADAPEPDVPPDAAPTDATVRPPEPAPGPPEPAEPGVPPDAPPTDSTPWPPEPMPSATAAPEPVGPPTAPPTDTTPTAPASLAIDLGPGSPSWPATVPTPESSMPHDEPSSPAPADPPEPEAAAAATVPTDLPALEPPEPVAELEPGPTATPAHAATLTQGPVVRVTHGIGRIPVVKVEPVIEGGAYPAKAVVGESFPIRARVFREGHDKVNASVVLTGPGGRQTRSDMVQIWPEGLDIWEVWVAADEAGDWTFRVEAWSDPWATWLHTAEVKLPTEVDVDLVYRDGHRLLTRSRDLARAAGQRQVADRLDGWAQLFTINPATEAVLTLLGDNDQISTMVTWRPRDLVSPTADFPLTVDRRRALYSSWYEFFPRSQGAVQQDDGSWRSGTFDTCHERLEQVAAMGFDIVYLPPIHPIGASHRKGRNNTLNPGPHDPGSPWAIGSSEGGHDAIHPDLGDFESFDRFVAKAHALGLEVAIDFALQASPDHPWVTEHPQWFSHRADGSIAYAENPPKKYQDIYPLNFDNDPEGLYHECYRLLEFWIERGVSVFRVDNPHTKPVQFWGWLLREVHKAHPEVLFLAEAFTRPEMMHALGQVGFHQSYTYFTWRTAKWELEEYLTELSHETAAYFRPNFFVNTPDINPAFLQSGHPAAFAIRAILAATASPSWGVYSGFELCEHEPLKPGGEEYLNSEKYEYRPRDFEAPGNLNLLLTTLNLIRRTHPALQQIRRLDLHRSSNNNVLVFSKRDGDDRIVVIISLNPEHGEQAEIDLDFGALGLADRQRITVQDTLTGSTWQWGSHAYVLLTPEQPAHIVSIAAD
jgi:starch synthase (maltosyl-transferring)